MIVLMPALAHGASLQEEFDHLCIYTQNAENLPSEKLRELLAECDQLQKKIDASNDVKKKLLSFRLNKCRNFFAYIIELRQSDNPGTRE